MIPNLLGNIPNWIEIYKIAKNIKLKLLRTLLIQLDTKLMENLGSFSDITTNSICFILLRAGFVHGVL